MLLKTAVFSLIGYFLIVFQTSFLAALEINFFLPNLAIIFILVAGLFEKQEETPSLMAAFIVGLFLSWKSKPMAMPLWLILPTMVLFIKLVVKKYVRFV